MNLDRRDFVLLLAAGAAAGFSPARAAAPLKFGVVPYLTARRLATLYEPARDLFERELERPVLFSSAPDYAAHLERLRAREYDLVADSLPVARLAQREFGYVPIARTKVPLLPVLVVPAAASGKDDLEAFRGKTIAVSDRLAALTIVGLRYLRDNGLQPNRDVKVRVAGSHANAVQLVLAGEASAAVVSRTTLKQIDPALAAQLRVLRELPQALSAVVYTVAPQLAARAGLLSRAFLDFAENAPPGRAFIESLGHQGLLPVGAELAKADPLVVEFYRQLNHAE
jgi:ABC-type phosphate/phosphonate transport system substrate-binding protein